MQDKHLLIEKLWEYAGFISDEETLERVQTLIAKNAKNPDFFDVLVEQVVTLMGASLKKIEVKKISQDILPKEAKLYFPEFIELN